MSLYRSWYTLENEMLFRTTEMDFKRLLMYEVMEDDEMPIKSLFLLLKSFE